MIERPVGKKEEVEKKTENVVKKLVLDKKQSREVQIIFEYKFLYLVLILKLKF